MSQRVQSNGKVFLILLIMVILGYIFVLLSLQKVRAEEVSSDQNVGEVETVQLSSESPEVITSTETPTSQEVVLTDEELTDLAVLQEEQQAYTIVQTYTVETAQSHNDFDCSVCHNTHASSSPKLITTSSTSDLCLNCHYALLEESREGSNCDLETYDCTICHDIHNSIISYSVEETIEPDSSLNTQPEPILENQTTTVSEPNIEVEPNKEVETTQETDIVQDTQDPVVDEPSKELSKTQVNENDKTENDVGP